MSRHVGEDWEPEDRAEIGTCHHCGKRDARVKLTVDPYVTEVYPEEAQEPAYWCYSCWDQRHDEI